MISSRFQIAALRLLAVAAAVLLATPGYGQSRPGGSGSAARSSVTSGANRAGAAGRTNSSSATTSRSAGPRQYPSNTLLGDAVIQIDPETRSLVIVTDEDTHRELVGVIRNLDKPKPQVLINVVFLEVTYNKGSDIGVEANYTYTLDNAVPATTTNSSNTNTTTRTTTSGDTNSVATNTVSSAASTAAAAVLARTVGAGSNFGLAALTTGSFVRVLSDHWSATLRAIATKGKVEILSRPSIMARNNQEAVIVVGSEVPFITDSRIDNNGNTINTIQYDNVGIILRVTPFITADNNVEMIVSPEISALTDQTVPISNTVNAPVISKRSAETVVVTPNEQTVVIGGLMETQRISAIQKVPILGDIPIIGFPFRRTITSDVKKELMIFLTPHIVNSAEGLAQLSAREKDKTELVEDAFSEEDLNKFLETVPLENQGQSVSKEIRRAKPAGTPSGQRR